jgi:protein-tyrosine phosphatase
VNIDFERRSKASYTGFAMVTSIAHVWFNAYFEGGADHDSGVFETEWSAMDGIKGSARKGIRALDKLKVVWRYPPPESMGLNVSATGEGKWKSADTTASAEGRPISEPKPGDPIPESEPADWRGHADKDEEKDSSESSSVKSASAGVSAKAKGMAHSLEKELGLRKQGDESNDVSLAGSEDEMGFTTDEEGRKVKTKKSPEDDIGLEGVKTNLGKNGEDKDK